MENLNAHSPAQAQHHIETYLERSREAHKVSNFQFSK